jgi:hypothetical protein
LIVNGGTLNLTESTELNLEGGKGGSAGASGFRSGAGGNGGVLQVVAGELNMAGGVIKLGGRSE